jgi:hypothetical protein
MTGPSPSLPAPQDGAERLAADCRERFQYAQPLSDVFDLTFGHAEQTRAPSAQSHMQKTLPPTRRRAVGARPAEAPKRFRIECQASTVAQAKRRPAWDDDQRARGAGTGRGFATLAFVLEAVACLRRRRERERRSRWTGVGFAQSWSPAVADIIGARRAWTVAMISSVSRPCR